MASLGLHGKHTAQVISNAYESLRTAINAIKIPLVAKERKLLASLRRPSFPSALLPLQILARPLCYSHTRLVLIP